MSFSFTQFADALRGGAEISAKDVLAARQWAWNDGGVSVAEADSIFELNRLAKSRSREWVEFVVEALTEGRVWTTLGDFVSQSLSLLSHPSLPMSGTKRTSAMSSRSYSSSSRRVTRMSSCARGSLPTGMTIRAPILS